MRQWSARVLWAVVWVLIALCLAVAIVPHFLDRLYYRGPVSHHFDGQRFFNPDGSDDALAPAHGGTVALRFLLGQSRAPWPDRVAITPDRPPARVTGGAMRVTWVGHSTVLVQTHGLNILTDPVWSRHVGPFGLVGPARVAEPGIRFDDLPKIDLVLVSHDHYDHMDLATLGRLWRRDRPTIVTSLGNDAVIGGAGVPAVARDWGGRVSVRPGIDVIVTRVHHWGSRWFTDRNRALWSGFVVTLPGGNLYFAGDTGAGDLRWADEARSYGPIRLALIPIGAFRFEPGGMAIGSHIGPLDAVEVFRRLGAAHAIGVHWGTFQESNEAYDTPPRLLNAAMRCTGQRGFVAVPLGRGVEVPAYAPPHPVAPTPRAATLACLGRAGAAAWR